MRNQQSPQTGIDSDVLKASYERVLHNLTNQRAEYDLQVRAQTWLALVLVPVSLAISAVTFMKLWGWFVAPLSPYLQDIDMRFGPALGLMVMREFFSPLTGTDLSIRKWLSQEAEKNYDHLMQGYLNLGSGISTIVGCPVILLMGWLVHRLVG